MGKIKLTKGELKRQRDGLRQFRRYLPTLQLKKQQLQLEISNQRVIIEQKRRQEAAKKEAALAWSGLLAEPIDLRPWIGLKEIRTAVKNIAGVDIVAFERAEFGEADYDLFDTPLWIDAAIEALRILAGLRQEIRILEEAAQVLRQELRITTQRVNLFEKVKIPQAQEAIRRIKIFLGDQTANAVGRSKFAKRKIEAFVYS
jgi:V/A-type H+-transporting ATPase subunit D